MSMNRKIFRRIVRWLWKPDIVLPRPLSTSARIKLMRGANVTWSVFKRLGRVRKTTQVTGYTDTGKQIKGGHYYIGQYKHGGKQPSGLKRKLGQTLAQAYRRLRKRMGV